MKNTRNYSKKTIDWKGWSMRNLSKSYKDKIFSWSLSWRERPMMIYLKALWSPKIPLLMEVVWKIKGFRVRTIIELRNIGRLRKQGLMTYFRIRTKFIQSIGWVLKIWSGRRFRSLKARLMDVQQTRHLSPPIQIQRHRPSRHWVKSQAVGHQRHQRTRFWKEFSKSRRSNR